VLLVATRTRAGCFWSHELPGKGGCAMSRQRQTVSTKEPASPDDRCDVRICFKTTSEYLFFRYLSSSQGTGYPPPPKKIIESQSLYIKEYSTYGTRLISTITSPQACKQTRSRMVSLLTWVLRDFLFVRTPVSGSSRD